MPPDRWHIVSGEFPPAGAGVADYTAQVAAGLAAGGADVHVHAPAPLAPAPHVAVHPLPDMFGTSTCRALAQALVRRPGTLLVQYVANALGRRGMNIAFCRWLRQQREAGADVRVMFHEPYFYFGWRRPWRNALAIVQRRMARELLRASSEAYLSTATWRRYLEPWAPADLSMHVLPIPSSIPRAADEAGIRLWRARFGTRVAGHFGTFGADVARELLPALRQLLVQEPSLTFVCAGEGSDRFVRDLPVRDRDLQDRVIPTGRLDPADASAVLQACDLLVQPYPDGVTTRRTSAMAGLANGVPVVTTDGALTEDVWRKTDAVALVPPGHPATLADIVSSLLDDERARRGLAVRGRETYAREFALDVTLDRLTHASAVRASA
jgi:glycosyltransferase involved in cell wall biosynthesis